MKKLFLIFTIIISPFFFISNVYGATYFSKYKIQDTYTTNSSLFDTAISDSISYGQQINKPYFILRYRNGNITVLFTDESSNYKLNMPNGSCSVQLYSGSSSDFYNYSSGSFSYVTTYGANSIYDFYTSSSMVNGICDTNYSYVYSNFNLYRYNSNIIITIYDSSDNEYLRIDSDSIPIPSLNDMYGTPPEPPEPPDSFPLLTSFYTLVVDKLVDICSYITSSYLFLSIFVIFTFYFVILLLRRLL